MHDVHIETDFWQLFKQLILECTIIAAHSRVGASLIYFKIFYMKLSKFFDCINIHSLRTGIGSVVN